MSNFAGTRHGVTYSDLEVCQSIAVVGKLDGADRPWALPVAIELSGPPSMAPCSPYRPAADSRSISVGARADPGLYDAPALA